MSWRVYAFFLKSDTGKCTPKFCNNHIKKSICCNISWAKDCDLRARSFLTLVEMGWYRMVHNFHSFEDSETLLLWTFLELYPQEKWLSYQNMYISTLGYQVSSSLIIFFSSNLTCPPTQLDRHFGFFLKVLASQHFQKNLYSS